MKKILRASIVLLMSFSAAHAWELRKDKNGVQVFTRKVDDSSLREFRGETIIKTSLSSLIALLDDAPSHTRWIHNCIEGKVLAKVTRKKRYSYNVIHAPWPVKNRDSVVYSEISQDPGTRIITILLKGTPDYIPQVNGIVRVSKLSGKWILTPMADGNVKVLYQVHSEPGGALPAFLANTSVVDIPYNTLLNMKTVVTEKKYQDAKYHDIME